MATTSSKSSGSSDEDLLDDFFAALEIGDDKNLKKTVLKIDKNDRDTSCDTDTGKDEFGQRDGIMMMMMMMMKRSSKTHSHGNQKPKPAIDRGL